MSNDKIKGSIRTSLLREMEHVANLKDRQFFVNILIQGKKGNVLFYRSLILRQSTVDSMLSESA